MPTWQERTGVPVPALKHLCKAIGLASEMTIPGAGKPQNCHYSVAFSPHSYMAVNGGKILSIERQAFFRKQFDSGFNSTLDVTCRAYL